MLGFVDVTLDFYAVEGHSRRRRITGMGRAGLDILDELVIELAEDGCGYRVVSQGASADGSKPPKPATARDILIQLAPADNQGGTLESIWEKWPSKPPALNTLRNVAAEAVRLGLLREVEAGVKGKPARYAKMLLPPETPQGVEVGGNQPDQDT